MSDLEATFAILGLAVLTLVSRSFFLLSDKELALPGWARRALKYAPLAALVAICVPEIVLSQGALAATFKDARVAAAATAAGYYFWRRGILGTIITGMAVFLPLRLALGW
jgi:branched-subunit amino acid transport protein